MRKLLISVVAGVMVFAVTACSNVDEAPVWEVSAGSAASSESIASTDAIEPPVSYKIASHEANMRIYKDLVELEASTDLIVKATFSGKREVETYKDDNGIVYNKETISTLNIKKVLKGDFTEKTVKIYEPSYLSGDTFVTIEGYNWVNANGDYVLFLKKTKNDLYTPAGMYQGKYDLKKSDKIRSGLNKTDMNSEYLGDNVDHFNKLKEEVQNKYVKVE